MTKTAQSRPCSTCLSPQREAVTETFADSASAFRRHTQLVQAGLAPSLCMRRDGIRYVCHLGKTAT